MGLMKKSFVPVVLLLLNINMLGQSLLKDTIQVQEVEVTAKGLSRFQVGSKIEKIPEGQFLTMQDGSLEQLLLRYTPISLKGMAGCLSTIRLRGTSPDHTSINFGGININSMTLGHSNVSNIPMYLFDKIDLQYGSASAVNGSGSIGGAIHLGMHNYWVDGFKSEVRIALGSFGEQLHGTKLFYGNGQWEGVTRAYYYAKTNDFPFYNTTHDFDKEGPYGEDIQRHAGIDNKGVIQEFNYRFNPNEILKIKAWVESDWHAIQQNMQTNSYQPDFRETYKDEHVRLWAEYNNRKRKFTYFIGGGYVYDNSIFNNSPDKISTQRILGKADGEYQLSSNNRIKAGTSIKTIFPDVYAYENLSTENWVDFYGMYYHNFFNKLTATLNVRWAYVTDFKASLTPALGISYNALAGVSYVLSFSGNVSRSYRVPTFNDRRWEPGGNPDLDPEEGMNYELGTKLSYSTDHLSGTIKINAFYLDVDNWLLWVNGNNGWEAQNVQRVKSKGIEIQSDWKLSLGQYAINPGINYTYNPVVRAEVNSLETTQQKSTVQTNAEKKTTDDQNAVERQLEYVPLHRGVIYLNGSYNKLTLGVDANYTYEQYTSQLDKTIPGFLLLNASVGYKLQINADHALRFASSVNNILNKDYQSSMGYPMPRINYRFSVTYNFK